MAHHDLVGNRYGRLFVVGLESVTTGGHAMWLCHCRCGSLTIVRTSSLVNGHTQSCGCIQREAAIETGMLNSRHGACRTDRHGTVEYRTWRKMKERCYNPRDKRYKDYGGRGVTVCKRWLDFASFLEDMGFRPSGYSIERIDVDGNYEPGNCVWLPMKDQWKTRRRP